MAAAYSPFGSRFSHALVKQAIAIIIIQRNHVTSIITYKANWYSIYVPVVTPKVPLLLLIYPTISHGIHRLIPTSLLGYPSTASMLAKSELA